MENLREWLSYDLRLGKDGLAELASGDVHKISQQL